MSEGILPEEKLLRLIRGQQKEKKPEAYPENLKPQPKANQSQERPYRPGRKIININFPLPSARKLLFLLLAISCFYMATSLIYPLIGLKSIKLPAMGKETPPTPLAVAPGVEKDSQFYVSAASGRNIFASSGIATETGAQTAGVAGMGSIQDLSLMGIISGDNPQAAIQDKKTQKVYYVSKGESVADFLIEDIQDGKIILGYKGQRYELRL